MSICTIKLDTHCYGGHEVPFYRGTMTKKTGEHEEVRSLRVDIYDGVVCGIDPEFYFGSQIEYADEHTRNVFEDEAIVL